MFKDSLYHCNLYVVSIEMYYCLKSQKLDFIQVNCLHPYHWGPLSPPPFFFPVVVVTSGTRFKQIIGPFWLWVTHAHTMIDLQPLLNVGDIFSGRNSSPGTCVTIVWLRCLPSSIKDSSVQQTLPPQSLPLFTCAHRSLLVTTWQLKNGFWRATQQ